jgi:hypothetical protein
VWVNEIQVTFKKNLSPPSSGLKIKKTRKQNEAGSKHTSVHAGFLNSLLLDSEIGGDIFLRNVGCISLNYTALYPRRENTSLQRP